MMTDIVERLRRHSNEWEPGTLGYGLLTDAADEIERLRMILIDRDETIDRLRGFDAVVEQQLRGQSK